jgi:hypothetical protein
MTRAPSVCGEDHVGIGSDRALSPWDTSPAAMAAYWKHEKDRIKAGVAAPEEDRPLYVRGLNTPRLRPALTQRPHARDCLALPSSRSCREMYDVPPPSRVWRALPGGASGPCACKWMQAGRQRTEVFRAEPESRCAVDFRK